jgi:replicative DNA helicase
MNLADLKDLPSNVLAERALIASIVDNNDILFDLSVNSSMFYGSEEKQIMKVIETISKETKSIDTTIVY